MSGFLENKLAMRPPGSGFRSPLTRFFKLGQMLDSLQHIVTLGLLNTKPDCINSSL